MKTPGILSVILISALFLWLGYMQFSPQRAKEIEKPVQQSNFKKEKVTVLFSSTTPVAEPIALTTTTKTAALVPKKVEDLAVRTPSLDYPTRSKEAEALTAKLRNNSDNRDLWLQLAIYAKAAEEYARSEEILLYITQIWRSDFVAFNNLGDLYQNYIKNYEKAEKAHQKAAELNPGFIQAYVNLYELYQFLYLEKKHLAPEALKNGLARNPTNIELMVRLARHYWEEKNSDEAAFYYRAAVLASERDGANAFAEKMRKEAAESGIIIQ